MKLWNGDEAPDLMEQMSSIVNILNVQAYEYGTNSIVYQKILNVDLFHRRETD